MSRNLSVGDVVLLTDEGAPRGMWRMARVTEVFESEDGLVRKVRVRTRSSTYIRPIHKLILICAKSDLEW